ncbi:MAG: hypothetical protein OK457_07135 [Thaumarchaeota archaeon]|nr:hypothetical protein [Nitrososphaerota archaeon]
MVKDDKNEVQSLDDASFKAFVVQLILSRNTEKAVELISQKFHVRTPKLGIGHTKGKKIALAVYSVAANSISFSDQDQFFDPFVVLHEMYHCLRSTSGNHRGTEKNADKFALDFIAEYNKKIMGAGLPFSPNPSTRVD